MCGGAGFGRGCSGRRVVDRRPFEVGSLELFVFIANPANLPESTRIFSANGGTTGAARIYTDCCGSPLIAPRSTCRRRARPLATAWERRASTSPKSKKNAKRSTLACRLAVWRGAIRVDSSGFAGFAMLTINAVLPSVPQAPGCQAEGQSAKIRRVSADPR